MKKILSFLLLAALLIFTTALKSQISIVSTDMPTAGDTIRNSTALNAVGFDFVQTGMNHIWDYRGLLPVTQQLDTFKTVLQTPNVFWPSFALSANLALRINAAALLPGVNIGTAFQYFSKTTASYRDFGYGLIVNGIPLPLKFSTPDVVYTFPMNVNQTTNSNSVMELGLPGIAYISIKRQRQNHVDGWGTLKTPYGSFSVLRVKSQVFEIDSIYIDSIGQGVRIDRNYIEYKWLGKNMKVPLLIATVDKTFGTMAVYRDSVRKLNVSVPELLKEEVLTVFPNPIVSDMLSFKICSDQTQNASIKIINIQGVIVFEDPKYVLFKGCHAYTLAYSPHKYTSGLYFIEVNISGATHRMKFISGKP